MLRQRYLVVGGGMTADAAVRGIRELDKTGTISLISAERDPPYQRPPLSKKLWQGQALDSIWCRTPELGVTVYSGRRVTELDLPNQRVRDERGEVYGFERLLLATGGAPRRLPGGDDAVIYFRTLDDYRRLRELAVPGARLAVVGGGFIGSEIAAALAGAGARVTMILAEETIGRRLFPAELSGFVSEYYRGKGVELWAGERVVDVQRSADGARVSTSGNRRLDVDGVVAGLGIEPAVELAVGAGLPVTDGIAVDPFLRAGRPDVYAAGDVASVVDPVFGRPTRYEHEDNALATGRQAGRNMAGADEPYQHLSFFYSDLFDLGYEAVGTLDSRLSTVVDWQVSLREGVIYYLQDRRVHGVLLWGIFGQVEAARSLIAEPGPFDASTLRGRLPIAARS